jgi:glucokinase
MQKYLGIDIGGSSAKCGIITSSCEILSRSSFETGPDITEETLVRRICSTVEDSLESGIMGIGLCFPGFIDVKTGNCLGGAENLEMLGNINLKRFLSEKYLLPVSVLNDVNAVALAETWVGAGRSFRNMVCVVLGTGIGGSIIIDGNIYEGPHLSAGEIGYLDYSNENDYCELRLSAKAIIKEASERLDRPDMDGFLFFELLRQEKREIVEIFDRWSSGLARVIANIITLLDPECVIIGGGISSEKDILIPALKDKIDRMLYPSLRGKASIMSAVCGNSAGMIGAARSVMCGSK